MKRFLNKINLGSDLTVAGKMFLVFFLISFSRLSHHYFFVLVALILFYALIHKNFISKSSFWLLISLVIIPGLWNKFYFAGNHVFLIFYVSLLLMIATYFSKIGEKVAQINAKVLLGIIMFFAVVQKLLSETFMSGSSLAFLNYKGGFFTHLQKFFPENKSIINENSSLVKEQTSSVESLSTTIELKPINWIFELDPNLLVYLILGTEILFFVLLFVKNQYIRNGFFTLFIVALIVTRIETGFASLLCILLFLQARKDHLIFKLIYLTIFSVFISLILTKLGFF